ncbi:MAG: insulinase family protein [Polyangiaceae bacterium]|nr:insulinase family protein [Polyangiaceae bacterium]
MSARAGRLVRGVRLAALALGAGAAACGEPPPAAAPQPHASAAPPAAGSAATVASAVDRTRLPEPGPTPEWAPPPVESYSLPNGIRVLHSRQGSTPLVALALVVTHGSATDPRGKSGLTELMVSLLDEGAGARSALDVSRELRDRAIDYGVSVEVDHATLWMTLLADAFGEAATLLADFARRPRFEDADVTRVRDEGVAAAMKREAEPTSGRSAALRRALFGGGYAGELPSGSQASLKRLRRADVKAQHAAVFAPDSVALVVVGRVERAEVERALGAAFGDWTGKASAAAQTVEAPGSPALHVVDYPGGTQASVAVARRAPPDGSDEHFPALVFNRAFGESFTGRINLNLREDKGWTYGARGQFRRFRAAGLYAIAAGVKTEHTWDSVREIEKELAGLCADAPFRQIERDEAVEGLLLGYPSEFETVGAVAGTLALVPALGRSPTWVTDWPRRVGAVTLEQATQASQAYCDASRYDVVVAGDWKALEPTAPASRPVVLHARDGAVLRTLAPRR